MSSIHQAHTGIVATIATVLGLILGTTASAGADDPPCPLPLLGSVPSSSTAPHVVVGDSLYILPINQPFLHIYDIADPTNPALLSTLTVPVGAEPGRDIAVANDIAYIAANSGGLMIVDVSDESAPDAIGLYDGASPEDVAVEGDLACIIHSTTVLEILDISDPELPALLGAYTFSAPKYSLTVVNNLAYVTGQSGAAGSLSIIDASDPQSPALIGSADPLEGKGFESLGAAVVDNERTYVKSQQCFGWDCDGAVHVYDVSQPSDPTLLGSTETLYVMNTFDVAGSLLWLPYSGDGEQRLRVMDVTDPANMMELAEYSMDGALGINVRDSLGLLFTNNNGLQFLDIGSCFTDDGILGDINGNGAVDTRDLLQLLGAWGTCANPGNCSEDLDDDGNVGVSDLLMLLGNWS